MTPEAYQARIAQPDILEHTTLNVTLKELAFAKETALVAALQRVLREGRIEKPEKPPAFNGSVHHYSVPLSPDEVGQVIDHLNALEEQHLAPDGSPTTMSNFYSTLADKWSALG